MDAKPNANLTDRTSSLSDAIHDTITSNSNGARESLAMEAGQLMSNCKAMLPKPPEGATLVASGTVNIDDADMGGAKCKGGVIEITPFWASNDGNKKPGSDPTKAEFVPGQGYEGNGKPPEGAGTFPPEGFDLAKPMPLPHFDGLIMTKPGLPEGSPGTEGNDNLNKRPGSKPGSESEGSTDGNSHKNPQSGDSDGRRDPDKPIDPGFDRRPHRPWPFNSGHVHFGIDPRLLKSLDGKTDQK